MLGGVRSGKSQYAQELAARGQRVAFLATAEARDDDMRQRIARHRDDRPASWTTIEAPVALEEALAAVRRPVRHHPDRLSHGMDRQPDGARRLQIASRILAHADRLAEALLRASPASVILVSNEVGSGIVPDNEMARTYRDLLGGMNQRVAAAADEVILLVAGCPLIIKQPVEALA